jgi:hypothetical protein
MSFKLKKLKLRRFTNEVDWYRYIDIVRRSLEGIIAYP